MIDQQKLLDSQAIKKLTPEMKKFLNETRSNLKDSKRRKFMAKVVLLLDKGSQRRAERELGWDRKTIIKGTKELRTGIECIDNFSGRGRHRIEKKLPNLLEDIRQIVTPVSQCDPNFRTTELYSPLTAAEVHRHVIEEAKCTHDELPTVRTINNKLNELDLRLKKVGKCKPTNRKSMDGAGEALARRSIEQF